MNRRIFAILAVLFVTGNFTLAEAQTETAPPEINDKWSIFSLPCTVDLLTAAEKDTFEGGVFEWDGSEYSKTTLIERGVGYITNVKNSGHIKQLCSGQIDTDDKTISYKTGWNLSGNPYKKAVLFTDLPGIPSKHPKHIIFELRGQKFVDITEHPVLNPWQGYWLYTEEDIYISLAKECSLELLAYSDADKTTELVWPVQSKMETIFLAPMETCTGDDGFISRTDRSVDASWTFRGNNTVSISKSGEFTPVTTGMYKISATVGTLTTEFGAIVVSNNCNIALKGYSDSERTALLNSGDAFSTFAPIFMEVIKTCYQADGTADETEISSESYWNIAPDSGGTINVETPVFSATANGEYEISAQYGEYESNSISVAFAVPECKLELLAYDSYEMTTPLIDSILNYGSTLFLSLNKVCSLNDEIISNEKVSDTVTWNLGKPELAEIDGSTTTLIPLRTGELTVRALSDGMLSNTLNISITMPVCKVEISKFSNTERTVPYNATGLEKGQNVYFSAQRICDNSNGEKSIEDITGEAVWFMGPNGLGTLTGPDQKPSGPMFTPSKSGLVYFWVKGTDYESAKVGVKVRIPECSVVAKAFMEPDRFTIIKESQHILEGTSVYLTGEKICVVPGEQDEITNITDEGNWILRQNDENIFVTENSFIANTAGTYEITFVTSEFESKPLEIQTVAADCSNRVEMYFTSSAGAPVASPATTYGEPISFKAIETCSSEGKMISETDISDKANWKASTDKYGVLDATTHTYTPSKSGSVGIYAHLNHKEIGKLVVNAIINECSYEVRAYAEHGNTTSRLVPPFNNTNTAIYLEAYRNCLSKGIVKSENISDSVKWNISRHDDGEGFSETWFSHGENSSPKYVVPTSSKTCKLDINAYSDEMKTKELSEPISVETERVYFSLTNKCVSLDNKSSEEFLVNDSENTTWFATNNHEKEFDKTNMTFTPDPIKNSGETDIYATYSDRDINTIHITILNLICEYEITTYSDATRQNELISPPEVTSSQRIFLQAISECKLRNTAILKEDVTRNITCTSEDINNKSFMDTKTGEFIPSRVGYGTSVCAVEDTSISINIRLISELSLFKTSTDPYIYTSSLKTNVNVYGLYRNKCSDEENNCNQQLRIQNLTQDADIIVNGQSNTDKGVINAEFCNNNYDNCHVQLNMYKESRIFYLMYRNFDDYTVTHTNKNGDISTPQPVSFGLSYNTSYHFPNEFIKARPSVDWNVLIDDFTWETMDSSIVSIEDGYPIAKSPGTTFIRAKFHNRTTGWTWITVTYNNYNDENLTFGSYTSKPVKTNEYVGFYMYYYKYELSDYCTNATETIYDICFEMKRYNVFNQNSITSTSNNLIFKGNSFTSTEPGFVKLEAEYNGLKSYPLTLDFWEEKDMHYCDGAMNNISDWNDSRFGAHVKLEASCNEYEKEDTVYIKYTAEIPTGTWYGGHCLELYVLDENYKILKTFRKNQYCGNVPLNSGRSSSRSMDKIYETVEDWDMTDDSGNRVAPGQYYAVARFNIYMDPVVEVPFVIKPDASSESEEIQE